MLLDRHPSVLSNRTFLPTYDAALQGGLAIVETAEEEQYSQHHHQQQPQRPRAPSTSTSLFPHYDRAPPRGAARSLPPPVDERARFDHEAYDDGRSLYGGSDAATTVVPSPALVRAGSQAGSSDRGFDKELPMQPGVVEEPLPPELRIENGGAPAEFYVFKAKGGDLVTLPDKTTIAYFLQKSFTMSGLNVTLRRGGKKGDSIVTVTKDTFSHSYNVLFTSSRWTTPLRRKGIWRNTHSFLAMDGVSYYKWKLKGGNWTGDWECTNVATKEVIADWTRSKFSLDSDMLKDNLLRINQNYIKETDLIVATILVLKERRAHKSTGRA
ncbi:hypothetical protein MNV49_003314 [Pseudohyphozyma bogoriensis]|nr:hypothetical protein MNV49_003314 [Pseudohyphozyma bogoriensis]